MTELLPVHDPAKMEALRTSAMEVTEKYGSVERFGLFSQPPPLGLGDCNYESKLPERDTNNNIVTGPRNFYTNPMQTGKGPTVYFNNDNFLNKEKRQDPYMDYPKIHRPLKSQSKPIKKDKDGAWCRIEPFYGATTKMGMYHVPGDKNARFGNPYEALPDFPLAKSKCMKNEDGGVTIGPKNILHHPFHEGNYNTTVRHTIAPFPKYIGDVYDSGRHEEYLARKKWTDKWKEAGTTNFRSMCSGPYAINKDVAVYGGAPPPGPAKKEWRYKGKLAHQDPFKPNNPNKKGKLGTFNQFQRLKPDPTAIHKAVKKDPEVNPKEAFKPSRGT